MKYNNWKVLVTLFVGIILVSPLMLAKDSAFLSESEVSTNTIFSLSYTPHSPINIESNSDFVSEGFSGNGTSSNPYMIEQFIISSTLTCISISDTNAFFVILDCSIYCEGSAPGIRFNHVENGEIRSNRIQGNSSNIQNGISLDYSSNNTIEQNVISHCQTGVDLYWCSYNVIRNNRISDDFSYGVILSSSTNNAVLDNTISNYTIGIEVLSSSYNLMMNNTLTENKVGIRFGFTSDYNVVRNNTIQDSYDYGISILSGSNNQIFFNRFIDNGYSAYDSGSGNHWNTTDAGNFWSDYYGSGVYNIRGPAGAIDYHPFIYVRPTTSSTGPTTSSTQPTILPTNLEPFGIPIELLLVVSVGSTAIMVLFFVVRKKR